MSVTITSNCFLQAFSWHEPGIAVLITDMELETSLWEWQHIGRIVMVRLLAAERPRSQGLVLQDRVFVGTDKSMGGVVDIAGGLLYDPSPILRRKPFFWPCS